MSFRGGVPLLLAIALAVPALTAGVEAGQWPWAPARQSGAETVAVARGPNRATAPSTRRLTVPPRVQDSSEPGRSDDEDQEAEGDPAYGRTPRSLIPYREGVTPYRRFFLEPPAYRGPGRGRPTPADLETVRIGVLAPLEGTVDAAAGTRLLRGVELAIAEANRAGGHQGLPFELAVHNDQQLWGSSANTLVELAYAERVWAIIGSIDSNSTHVALRAALKAEVPIVNVGSTDPTVTETAIPWIVRCTPDDRRTGYRLARLLFDELGLDRVAVLRSGDRYGRLGVAEFRDAARRLGNPLPMEIQFGSQDTDFTQRLERIRKTDAQAIVLWTRARAAGEIVRQIRSLGMEQVIVGTDRLASAEFLEAAGDAAEGVMATAWLDPGRQDPSWTGFVERYRDAYGSGPGAFAAYGYDAARMTIEALERSGLNRARLRDELMGLRDYSGVAGRMEFDSTSNNVAPLLLATVQGGRFVYR